VLEAVLKTMNVLDRTAASTGCGLDAVPYLIEREGTICENLEETHDVLKKIRSALDARIPIACSSPKPISGRPTCGRTSARATSATWPSTSRSCRACSWRCGRRPPSDRRDPAADAGHPENCQWAMFLRNHDELTLEMVTDEERDYMYQAYAADPQMRINVGIRRRLAPLLENSRRRSSCCTRCSSRCLARRSSTTATSSAWATTSISATATACARPMQWTGDRNAGFSRADPARLFAPPVMDPVYGYQAINVEAQERAPFSLLNWMKRMIGLRKQFQVFGRGTIEFLPAENRKILAYLRRYKDGRGPLRREPVALGAAGRARSQPLQGPDAGRDAVS
jgi:maltose alpha-D-glucosyltransferase/alpha-amylase